MNQPPEGSEIHERTAGRALIVDADNRVLMLRGIDPDDTARGGFWWTPGGGINPGESLEDGTRRELWEEVGLRVRDLGPVVLERVDVFAFGGRWIRQHERFHAIDSPEHFVPQAQALEALEVRAIRELRWLSPAELRALPEPFFPRCLADLIEHIAAHGRPDPPWRDYPGVDT